MKFKIVNIPLILLLIFFSIKLNRCAAEDTTVVTKTNTIRGKIQDVDGKKIATFLGIPYAKPPVGDLRFKKTVPLEPSTSAIQATKPAKACIQLPIPTIPWSDLNVFGKSEDCLYLNIWAPFPLQNTVNQRLPVMFFVHGGAFMSGSNRMDLYDGRMLSAKGDVITVVINYRLGPLGFLNSGSSDAPGNAGLFDCLEALKWVYNNIENFGGDNTKITIFGESAGSVIVSAFASSPLAHPYFNRLIMQSSSSNTPMFREYQKQNYKRTLFVAKHLLCYSKSGNISVSCLRRINPYLLSIIDLLNPDMATLSIQRDDDILLKDPAVSVQEGDLKNVDLLIGVNKDETSIFLPIAFPQYFGPFGNFKLKITKPLSKKILHKIVGIVPEFDSLPDYYLDKVNDSDSDGIRRQMYRAFGEGIIICPSLYFAEKMSENNSVYFYNFYHRPSKTRWAKWTGTGHFEELQFVFGLPLRKPKLYTKEEVELSSTMIKLWTSFAKTGKPEFPYSEGEWPLFTKESPKYVIINTTAENPIMSNLHKGNCDLQKQLLGLD